MGSKDTAAQPLFATRRVAILQPYLHPYNGNYQLMRAANVFIGYDDANLIKQGWINRNLVLVIGTSLLFSLPLSRISPFSLIKDVEVDRYGILRSTDPSMDNYEPDQNRKHVPSQMDLARHR